MTQIEVVRLYNKRFGRKYGFTPHSSRMLAENRKETLSLGVFVCLEARVAQSPLCRNEATFGLERERDRDRERERIRKKKQNTAMRTDCSENI